MRTVWRLCCWLFPLGASTPVAAVEYGLADPGFTLGSIRTTYADSRAGTAARPLRWASQCLFPDSFCAPMPAPYAQGNYYERRAIPWCGPYLPCSYWVLAMNNEPAFLNCNSGPPEVSLPRAVPGRGIMGFDVLDDSYPGDDFPRAHLVLNLDFPNPCDGNRYSGHAIPFLSIGASRDNGNLGLTPGALNRSRPDIPQRLVFTARLAGHVLPDCDRDYAYCRANGSRGYVDFSVWAVARWGGVPRMLFVDLFHPNRHFREPNRPAGAVGPVAWNWPVQDDHLAPGADIAFLQVEQLPALCDGYALPVFSGAAGEQFEFSVDLQRLFRCASDLGLFREAMPEEEPDLPITDVAWKNEAWGIGGWLWMTVHGMRMVP